MLNSLRQWMSQEALEVYIVPTADPHNSEYIAPHWACREWLTGFTGSAGTAVVTQKEALLWTDSRYWLQASEELSTTGFQLMKDGAEGVPSVEEWIHEHYGSEARIGAPADMEPGLSHIAYCSRKDAFSQLWTTRPALPAAPIRVQDEQWTGQTIKEKLCALQHALEEQRTETDEVFLLNDLSDIAWTLNLRGADVDYNPVFLSYLAYEAETQRFTLYTHAETLTSEARERLAGAGVATKPYAEALKLKALPSLRVCRETACMGLWPKDVETFHSPVEMWRAVKSEQEQEGMRRAMVQDGVAMVKFLRWLDERMEREEEVTELSVDEKLTALRAEQPEFEGLSFGTIAAFGAHGAIVHYEADEHSSVRLPAHGLLLLDSGGQYLSGTTDLTRTIALGGLTQEEREVYTLVMKGHLRLAHMKFPVGTTGLQLDTAARIDLWAQGYDFGHGTGHGVGAHGCVHEGPHQIRKNVRPCTLVPFTAGMTVTDEPGIYVEGRFGVRIENTLLCQEAEETPYGRFLQFETLTLCPYDLQAVDRSLLSPEEMEQINAYHARVRSAIMPLLTDDADRIWLAKKTAAVDNEDF